MQVHAHLYVQVADGIITIGENDASLPCATESSTTRTIGTVKSKTLQHVSKKRRQSKQ
jgi:hypothetical protein